MRHAAFGIMAGLMVVLLLVIYGTILNRDIRTNETDESTREATRSAMRAVYQEDRQNGTGENEEERKGDVAGRLLLQVESDSNVELNLAAADEDILSVNMKEDYTHPNGAAGKTETFRTIFKDAEEEEEEKTVTMRFYASREDLDGGADPIGESESLSGEKVYQPDFFMEAQDGKTFTGFADASGNLFTDGMELETREGETNSIYNYYAVYQ